MTPRQLFESPQFAQVMTDNALVLTQGHINLQTRRPQLHARIGESLKSISLQLWQKNPDSGEQFDNVHLKAEEQEGFLTMMRSMSDPRVKLLGQNVALALHNSVAFSRSGSEATTKIMSSLEPQVAQIRRLRDEVIPEVVRGSRDADADDASLRIDTEGVSFLKSFKNWHMEVDVSTPQVSSRSLPPLPEVRRLLSRRLSSSGTSGKSGTSDMDNVIKVMQMKESAEKYFEQVQEFAASKYNIHVPDMEESLRGVDTTKLTECAMSAAMSRDMTQIMECAMEFWSIAMEVMQNVVSSVGVVTTSTEQHVFKSMEDLLNN
mmetsp:Transcript_35166/g.89427  ORF Transcript_35166/g.89427 Transcript_35166/m.89427 type:complete len:319 (+) Transcript_35166:438-1394(+)